MTERGVEITAIARSWIGTSYQHRGSCQGVGCDCLGLVRGIWRGIHGQEPGPVPFYTPDWGEYDGAEPLMAAARRYFLPDDAPPFPGQILLFRMRRGACAKHLGVVSEGGHAPSFIHAYDPHGVVESPLSAPWLKRIAARFRFPD
ncbi:peptidase [Paracoccus aerodenitrificans]|uniref:peptidase n=1 Tax=Paracoccus aerodenitrificans TaxID=3017781 RepID=UPI0022F12478|nr:peptidase [Paracoccus aerodenitrificans]WBU65346.1 peptidase [Paracoccus aerodenitrificans]